MKLIFRIIAWIGLGLTIIPSILVLSGQMAFGAHYIYMLIGTILWFSMSVLVRRLKA